MGSRCGCGTEIHFAFNHLGCIECGAACCPACSYQLESTTYCSSCAGMAAVAGASASSASSNPGKRAARSSPRSDT